MQNSEPSHGQYVARWKNGEVNTGYDARLVLEQRLAGDA
jgi:hypothetical protein